MTQHRLIVHDTEHDIGHTFLGMEHPHPESTALSQEREPICTVYSSNSTFHIHINIICQATFPTTFPGNRSAHKCVYFMITTNSFMIGHLLHVLWCSLIPVCTHLKCYTHGILGTQVHPNQHAWCMMAITNHGQCFTKGSFGSLTMCSHHTWKVLC